MLRTERTLAGIRARVASTSSRDLTGHARVDLRRLVGAVDGVLALHAPDGTAGCRICRPRRRHRGWPCPTLRTIHAALDGPEQPEPAKPAGPAGGHRAAGRTTNRAAGRAADRAVEGVVR